MLSRRLAGIAPLVVSHGPSAVVAIGLAEVFFKFHSFTLESLAFLATWYVVDAILEWPLQALTARLRGVVGRLRSTPNGRTT